MPAHPLAVSIVILNYNGRPWLERCLGAAVAECGPDCELLVVDKGSSDGSVDFLERAHPSVRVIGLERHLGFAEGNSAGAREARGRYLAFLNNDAAPQAGSLRELRRALDADDAAAAIDFLKVGHFRTFLSAKWHAFRELSRVWQQRRAVQRSRRSSWSRIWRLMDRRWLGVKLREKRFDLGMAPRP